MMDWNLLGLTFMTVFLAEIGDKSHLAAIALGGSTQHPKAVFGGTAAALLLTSFLGVWLGSGAAQLLPTAWVKMAAAIGFGILGVRLLWGGAGTDAEAGIPATTVEAAPRATPADPGDRGAS